MQLQRVEERSEERSAEVERLRSEAVELLADMAGCRRKEAELLEFTQKLTDKNVTLQVSKYSSSLIDSLGFGLLKHV